MDAADYIRSIREQLKAYDFEEVDIIEQSGYLCFRRKRSRVRAVASKHGLDEGELSKRELHDAELSVLQSMDDWDIAVALEVLERRGVDVDEETVRSVYEILR
ncbi:hypothetical protein [Halobaculum limi]|uniref:hypothetical protein n=1 Tax=Halobaculum limi TaxID=3031916 RepID=UPI0024056874|nr:hypothetical protein [Halobaculum sp. YSMS11]